MGFRILSIEHAICTLTGVHSFAETSFTTDEAEWKERGLVWPICACIQVTSTIDAHKLHFASKIHYMVMKRPIENVHRVYWHTQTFAQSPYSWSPRSRIQNPDNAVRRKSRIIFVTIITREKKNRPPHPFADLMGKAKKDGFQIKSHFLVFIVFLLTDQPANRSLEHPQYNITHTRPLTFPTAFCIIRLTRWEWRKCFLLYSQPQIGFAKIENKL